VNKRVDIEVKINEIIQSLYRDRDLQQTRINELINERIKLESALLNLKYAARTVTNTINEIEAKNVTEATEETGQVDHGELS
jgi:hypothetical protein